jgi:hypothetical protein
LEKATLPVDGICCLGFFLGLKNGYLSEFTKDGEFLRAGARAILPRKKRVESSKMLLFSWG